MPLMLTIVPTAAFMIASACQPMPLTKVHVVAAVEDTTVGTSYDTSLTYSRIYRDHAKSA